MKQTTKTLVGLLALLLVAGGIAGVALWAGKDERKKAEAKEKSEKLFDFDKAHAKELRVSKDGQAVARLVLDVALPTLCVACREPVDGEGVCAQCWAKLSFIARPFCPRLGIPFVYDPGPELLSMEAIASPPAYARARAAVRYDDVAKTLVHALKYQDRTDLAPAMGRWMARAGKELLAEADVLVPVPLHWRRGGAAATTSPARWRG